MTKRGRIYRGPGDAIRRSARQLPTVFTLVGVGCTSEPPPPHLTPIDVVLPSAVERGKVPGLVAAAVGPSGGVYEGASDRAGDVRGAAVVGSVATSITA